MLRMNTAETSTTLSEGSDKSMEPIKQTKDKDVESNNNNNKDNTESVQTPESQNDKVVADRGWNLLRHSRTCIIILLILAGVTAGALTYSFSNQMQEENFDLQVRIRCVSGSAPLLRFRFQLNSVSAYNPD